MTLEGENSGSDFFETEIIDGKFVVSIGKSELEIGICEWWLNKDEVKKLISELTAFIEDE